MTLTSASPAWGSKKKLSTMLPKLFPKVHFEHASGYKAAANVVTYETRFYEGAYLLSSLDYFRISGWLTLAPLILVWLARRPRSAQHAAAD